MVDRQVRGMFNQTAAWMRANGWDVPNSQVVVGHTGQVDGVRDQSANEIAIDPRALVGLRALAAQVYGPKRRDPMQSPQYGRGDVALMLHELVHGKTSSEGMTEATAMDLLPAWANRFLGERMKAPAPGYHGDVQAFRLQSQAATGKPWLSRDARVWRRARVNAGQP